SLDRRTWQSTRVTIENPPRMLRGYHQTFRRQGALLDRAPRLLPAEGLAQVDALDIRVATERGRCSIAEDAAVVDDVGVVGDGQRFAYVVVGDKYSDARALQFR